MPCQIENDEDVECLIDLSNYFEECIQVLLQLPLLKYMEQHKLVATMIMMMMMA